MRDAHRSNRSSLAALLLLLGCSGSVSGIAGSALPDAGGSGGTATGQGRGTDGGVVGQSNDAGVPPAGACGATQPPAGVGTGATWHVAKTGSDGTGTGASGAPFATVKKALAAAGAGDVILVGAGTYPGPGGIDTGKGTAEHPVWIKPEPGAKVVFDGGPEDMFTFFHGAGHVVLDGFEIENAAHVAIALWEADGITIRNCHIHDTHSGGAIGGPADDVTIEHNTIVDICTNSGPNHCGTSGVSSISYQGQDRLSKNWQVRDNEIARVGGECLNAFFLDGFAFVGNRIHDCVNVNIYADHAKNGRIERNYSYTTSDRYAPGNSPGRGSGIRFDVENYSADNAYFGKIQHFPFENIVVANNILAGDGWAIAFLQQTPPNPQGTMKNVTFAYNVLVDSYAATMFLVAPSSPPSGVLFTNNMFLKGPRSAYGDVAVDAAWKPAGFSSNLFSAGAAANVADARAVLGDPKLVSPVTGGPAEGFQLAPGSPAFRAGVPVPGVETDFFCHPRSTTSPSIGVHEPASG